MQSSFAKPRLVVDARMILSSGIGRYLRSALAALEHDDIELILLGKEAEIRRACPRLDREVIELGTPIYDPREHLALARAVPPCDAFFSPHVTTTRLRLRAKRRVCTIHDAFHLSAEAGFGAVKRAYSRFIYDTAMRVSDTVLTVSEFTRGELERGFPRYAPKLRVVPNFIDRSTFFPDERLPLSIAGRYVLFVGNLKPHKNLAAAVDALKLLRDEDLRLAVVGGDSGFIHGLGENLQKLRTDARLAFLGQVDDAELRRLYSHAECLVMPSLYEGFGYPPLEAMACGCPALCSSIPALRETAGEAGIFRDPRSPSDLAEGIERAIERGELRSGLIRKGFDRVGEFTKERFEAGIRSAVRESLCLS